MKSIITKIESHGMDQVSTAHLCLQAIVREQGILKRKIDPAAITEPEQQIAFYKNIFPAFMSEIIYYIKLLAIESGKPALEPSAVRDYYDGRYIEISGYLDQQFFLRSYYHQGRAHLDQLLFLPTYTQLQMYPDTAEYKDAAFFNFNSFSLAKIRAYERLHGYVLQADIEKTVTTTKVSSAGPNREDHLSLEQNEIYRQEFAELERKISWMEKEVDTTAKDLLRTPIEQLLRQTSRKSYFLERFPKERKGDNSQ